MSKTLHGPMSQPALEQDEAAPEAPAQEVVQVTQVGPGNMVPTLPDEETETPPSRETAAPDTPELEG